MSTRCQIGVYESKNKPLKKWDVLLYRHCDGYPDNRYGVVKILKKFLTFWERSGVKCAEYCGARLLQYLCNEYDKAGDDGRSNGLTGVLSYGICDSIHGDIAYFYRVYPHEFKIYKASRAGIKSFKLIKTVKI